MRTIIHSTNVDLDIAVRRTLDTQLLRELIRSASDIDLATAYISNEDEKSQHCRVAIRTKDGRFLSTESNGSTHAEALSHATVQMAAALQREQLKKHDPRLHRSR